MENATVTRRGHLLLADVSGYTAFLAQSELEHAQEILRALFNALLTGVRDPWRVCEVEGDAVFAYAPEETILPGQTLLEAMESLYCAFAGSRELMQRNTTCACTACRLISTLDLKFVAHFGTFVLQQLIGQTAAKPSGPDVILLHRLLKNTIRERTGFSAYAFVTEASVDALHLQEVASHLTPHSEDYPHLGRVGGYVYDLLPFWTREKERRRERVEKEDAWISCEREVAAPPQVVWGYLHDPARKRKWRNADEVRVLGSSGGRRDLGTTHHCVHGDMVFAELVVDWRPFEYFTCREQWPFQATTRSTTSLTPTAAGTRVELHVERPGGRTALRAAAVVLMYSVLRKSIAREQAGNMDRLRRLVESETAREFDAI